MKKRETVLGLLALLAAPLAAQAQPQGKVWRIGYLSSGSRSTPSNSSAYEAAFTLGMRELGYVEGKNLAIEWRHADNKFERLPGLAAELVQLKVDVIVTGGPQPTSAAKNSTTTIPIVTVVSYDPVESGLVASLARPGGNVTGLSNFSVSLGPKHLEILRTMVPKLSHLAVLVNPTNSGHAALIKSLEAPAQKAGVTILPIEARHPQEIESAFSAMTRAKAGACLVMLDPFFIVQRRQIADLAAKHRLPSLSPLPEYAEVGGLMSYGQNVADQFRRMATFVDKIVKGAKAGDIPMEQPTKFELLINRNTARVLGLTIPQMLLISADKLID